MSAVVFRSRRVVLPDGARPASVHARAGLIEAIREYDDVGRATLVDAGDAALLPGLVDTHVHVNEPGRTEWEGFASATAAAAAGGVTTLVDMPLNSVPATTTVEALRLKLDAARGRCRVDVAFWGGVVPGNAHELAPLVEAGVRGFKCFLVPSGVDEFEHVGEAELRAALPILARLDVPLLAHAELPGPIEAAARDAARGDPRAHDTWLRSRPEAAELEAIELLVRLSSETGARVHVVHVSVAAALPLLREARARGVPISAETCPHYLAFASEDVPDGACEYKCAPPIRSRANREALWAGLATGDLDLIATDHSPCPPGLKHAESGDFFVAWGGVSSLELGLAVSWTGAAARGLELDAIARWMSAAPARLAGLEGRKGALAVGHDADLVVFDPDAEWTVDPARLHQRHRLTPYADRQLRGAVRATYLRGEPVQRDGSLVDAFGGRLLTSGGV